MELVIIAAVAEQNRVIGRDMDLPWHLPEDLKRFKQLTTGHPLLMGRKTFESLVSQFDGPLPGRRNVVLTSQGTLPDHPDIETYGSVEAALKALAGAERVFVGGGAAIYAQFLPIADRMELTLVDGAYEGDTFFPPYDHLVGPLYRITQVDARDGFRFVTFVRRSHVDAEVADHA